MCTECTKKNEFFLPGNQKLKVMWSQGRGSDKQILKYDSTLIMNN